MPPRYPSAAILFTLALIGLCEAQDEKDRPPLPAKTGEALEQTEREATEAREEAEKEAKQADTAAHTSKQTQADAALKATQARTVADAAAAEVEKLAGEAAAAQAAYQGAKASAEAEGASDEQRQAATAAEARLREAEAALAAAKERAAATDAEADEAEAAAKQAAQAETSAREKAGEAAAAKAEADAKLRAAEAAQKAMQRVANRKRGPKVPLDELGLLIKPMDKEELEAEAEAWQQVLKAKATGISYGEIAIRHTEGEEKAAVLDALTKLRGEQTAVIDRLNRVLQAYEKKGGDASTYKSYIAAATGITLDVKDASALWTTVYGWATSPEGGVRWLINLVWFFGTLLAFRILGSALAGVAGRALRSDRVKTSDLLKDFLANVIRKAITFVGLIVALSMLEVNIGPLMAAMGGATLVIGFALQGTLSNFAAGVMILLYRPYDVGHVVQVAGVKGKVSAMSLVSTSLVTPDNQVVIVPNNSIWGGVITNVTARRERRVDLVFGIGYGDDIAKAEEILNRLVKSHPKVLADPAPVIKVDALADSSVNFVVRPWVSTQDYWDVYWDLTRQVKDAFDEAGVSIPFPQHDVHLHQVATTAGA